MSEPNAPAEGAVSAAAPRSTLVTEATPNEVFTARQETSARLACARGIAEYLSDMTFDAWGGRRFAFKGTFDEWADPEEIASYPSARIAPVGDGAYEARSLTPTLDEVNERLPQPDGRYLLVSADYVQQISVEVYATDTVERDALQILCENAFTPNLDTYSFSLQLPHYFNARGTYEMVSVSVADDPENAKRRYRIFTMTLAARVPLIRLVKLPDARPRAIVEAVSPDPAVLDPTQDS